MFTWKGKGRAGGSPIYENERGDWIEYSGLRHGDGAYSCHTQSGRVFTILADGYEHAAERSERIMRDYRW